MGGTPFFVNYNPIFSYAGLIWGGTGPPFFVHYNPIFAFAGLLFLDNLVVVLALFDNTW